MGRKVVLKVGSSSIIDDATGQIKLANLSRIVEAVCEMKRAGDHVVLVSSGAVGTGMMRLGMKTKPKIRSHKQAAAAVGQGRLMRVYDDLFSQMNQPIAQVLLTRADFGQRAHYLNECATLKELLAMGVVPIVNENDTVSTTEVRFGDNDTLSALIAGMVDAQWLFLLTDVDALYTSNPSTDPDAKPIRVANDLSELHVNVDGAGSSLGTGGMATKLTAADLATSAGCATVICRSDMPEDIPKIINGAEIGTVFVAKDKPLGDRKWWIKHGLHCYGRVVVDDGAVDAIHKRNSLFAAGIVAVEGSFSPDSCVAIVSEEGQELGRGLVKYSSAEIERVRGKHSSEIVSLLGYMETDCVIHRHNMALDEATPSRPISPELVVEDAK